MSFDGGSGERETEAAVRSRHPLRVVLLALCCLGFTVLAFWSGGHCFEAMEEVRDDRSQDRFAQIRDMLLIYHQQHGAFPPTKYQAKPGGPVHSWRVLLVAHTDTDFADRYRSYDLSQAWNSPTNVKALGGMPYFWYFSMDDDNDITNYLAIGDGDEWPAHRPMRSLLVTEGKDRFLVVEDPHSKIHWMEPKY